MALRCQGEFARVPPPGLDEVQQELRPPRWMQWRHLRCPAPGGTSSILRSKLPDLILAEQILQNVRVTEDHALMMRTSLGQIISTEGMFTALLDQHGSIHLKEPPPMESTASSTSSQVSPSSA